MSVGQGQGHIKVFSLTPFKSVLTVLMGRLVCTLGAGGWGAAVGVAVGVAVGRPVPRSDKTLGCKLDILT